MHGERRYVSQVGLPGGEFRNEGKSEAMTSPLRSSTSQDKLHENEEKGRNLLRTGVGQCPWGEGERVHQKGKRKNLLAIDC